MKKFLVIDFVFTLALASCNGSPDSEKKDSGLRDSSSQENQGSAKDTASKAVVVPDSSETESAPASKVKTNLSQPVPNVGPEFPKPSTIVREPAVAEGTTIHKYKDGKVSVEITPWNENRQKIFLFSPTGSKSYEFEDVRLSYQISTRLFFHENGAVKKAVVHNNPGASRYWYETTVTFSNANEPEWKIDVQMPQDHIETRGSNKSYWNNATGKWVKQEIVKEQPVPRE